MRIPAYRRLLVAYGLNELTWAIGSLALTVLVYRRTGSALGASAYFLCAQFVPALLSPWLVAVVERFAPRRVLPLLYGLEAAAFAVLAWLAVHFALAPILILTVLDGIVAVSARALARACSVAVTAPADLLREGNALTNAVFSACFMAGPAMGGVVVAAGGTAAALLVAGALFLVIALTLATTAGLPPGAAPGAARRGRLRAALAHATRRPAIRDLLALQAAGILFFTVPVPVEVVLVDHTLHAGAGGYGTLLAVWGAGAVLGSAVYARGRAWPQRALISVGSGALGAGFAIMAAAPALAIAIVGAAVAGIGNGLWSVSIRTALQELVEPRWMALMMSLNESIFQGVPGAGILLGGALTVLDGPRVALVAGGAGALGLSAIAAGLLRWPVRGRGGGEFADPVAAETSARG